MDLSGTCFGFLVVGGPRSERGGLRRPAAGATLVRLGGVNVGRRGSVVWTSWWGGFKSGGSTTFGGFLLVCCFKVEGQLVVCLTLGGPCFFLIVVAERVEEIVVKEIIIILGVGGNSGRQRCEAVVATGVGVAAGSGVGSQPGHRY